MFGLFKRREIELADKSDYQNTLKNIAEILRDNGFNAQEEVVREVISSLLRDEKDEFVKKISSVDMWGGAGSVWEVVGFRTKPEEIQFWRLLIQLTEQMKESGITNQHAFSAAKILSGEIKNVREK